MRTVNAIVLRNDTCCVKCGAPGCGEYLGTLHPWWDADYIRDSWEAMPRKNNARPRIPPIDVGTVAIGLGPGWQRGDFDRLELTMNAIQERQLGRVAAYQHRAPGVANGVSTKMIAGGKVSTGCYLAPLPAQIICPNCSVRTLNIVSPESLTYGKAIPHPQLQEMLGLSDDE